MSKSFSIDLKHFTLTRTIGSKENILRRAVDAYDVEQTLSDLGYTGFNPTGYQPKLKSGLIPDLESCIESATLGIPTHAGVKIKKIAGNSRFIMVTLIY